MQDRYLYCAKRIDNGEWVVGFYHWTNWRNTQTKEIVEVTHSILPIDCQDSYHVDTSTICQCTGLKDKNGKLIFENDIVRCGKNCTVTWCDTFASWRLNTSGWMYSHFFGEACKPEDVEIVGNIFDNPELLEQ